MLEALAKIDPAQVQAWLGVLLAVLAVVKWYQDNRERDRAELIRELVPKAHDVAERIAQATHTAKDDEFVAALRRMLEVCGFKLRPGEVKAIKDFGTAEHESRKAQKKTG